MKLKHVNTDYWAALSKGEMQELDKVMEQNPTARIKIYNHMLKKDKPSEALFYSFGFTATIRGAGYWTNVYRRLFQNEL